ncbi:hypothetical protein [Absidia glauca]|uniref:DUF125-domain-containing protein n=1 Tax=Absidia glauca TaxID=4829 RepID=A0A163JTC5_ABSGL|nr:hypothetical protein [Absidia glauca]
MSYQPVQRYSKEFEKRASQDHLLSSPEDSDVELGQLDHHHQRNQHRIPHRHDQKVFKDHVEEHFSRPELVKDCILGLADGLTVPFALAAGLSSLGDTRIVVYGGLAGAISMGLGGYLAAKSEAEHYETEREREAREVELYPEEEEEEIIELFEPYGLDRSSMEPMMVKFRENTEKFVDFMMRFELNLELPDPNRSWISALTIGTSYLLGGFIPLLPYFFIDDTNRALLLSVLVTSLTLFVFGYVKSIYLRPKQAFIGAIQTLTIGAVAAACSYGIVALVNESSTTE